MGKKLAEEVLKFSIVSIVGLCVALTGNPQIALAQGDDGGDFTQFESAVEAPAERDAPAPSIAGSFGPSGLLAEFNSNENFGNVQARLGAYRTHQAFANAGGPVRGYRDDFTTWLLPTKAIVEIAGSDRLYLRPQVTLGYSEGTPGNLTQTVSTSRTLQMQLVHAVNEDTVVAIGGISTRADIDLRHNGGDITNTGIGLQIDAMHKLSDRFGVTGRFIVDGVERETSIPLVGGGEVRSLRSGERVYAEANAAFTLLGTQSPLVPEGWRLRPVLTGVFQHTDLDDTTNNRGAPVPASNEDYGAVFLTARLEQTNFRPWAIGPYFEAGAELQVFNTASTVEDDPTSLYLRAG